MTNFSIIENRISSAQKYLSVLDGFKKYSKEEKELRKPSSMAENFQILEENKIINLELCEELVKMTGFRNIVAHDYEKINYDIVFDVLNNRLDDIKEFISAIKNNLNL